ncbi:hypothetical protein BDV19DRAFT_335930 [Aspergillus venezuelensis]
MTIVSRKPCRKLCRSFLAGYCSQTIPIVSRLLSTPLTPRRTSTSTGGVLAWLTHLRQLRLQYFAERNFDASFATKTGVAADQARSHPQRDINQNLNNHRGLYWVIESADQGVNITRSFDLTPFVSSIACGGSSYLLEVATYRLPFHGNQA